jgi:hypothetical protein
VPNVLFIFAFGLAAKLSKSPMTNDMNACVTLTTNPFGTNSFRTQGFVFFIVFSEALSEKQVVNSQIKLVAIPNE